MKKTKTEEDKKVWNESKKVKGETSAGKRL